MIELIEGSNLEGVKPQALLSVRQALSARKTIPEKEIGIAKRLLLEKAYLFEDEDDQFDAYTKINRDGSKSIALFGKGEIAGLVFMAPAEHAAFEPYTTWDVIGMVRKEERQREIGRDQLNSPAIKGDVLKAKEVLIEEGFQLTSRNSSFWVYEHDNGDKVTVPHDEYSLGMMFFAAANAKQSETKMAWDYLSEMRPNALQRLVRRIGAPFSPN